MKKLLLLLCLTTCLLSFGQQKPPVDTTLNKNYALVGTKLRFEKLVQILLQSKLRQLSERGEVEQLSTVESIDWINFLRGYQNVVLEPEPPKDKAKK